MAFGDSNSSSNNDALYKKLEPWLNNPPDYSDVEKAYKTRGFLNAKKVQLQRDIERIEDDVVAHVDKPRSNEARIRKLEATREAKDKLAELEVQIAINDSACKLLEYQRSMFAASIYRTKIQFDLV